MKRSCVPKRRAVNAERSLPVLSRSCRVRSKRCGMAKSTWLVAMVNLAADGAPNLHVDLRPVECAASLGTST